jgi:sugar phosphate isomerase/epimerase
MDRRIFLKSMAATALAGSTGLMGATSSAFACTGNTKIGVQLYTLRAAMKKSVEHTLETVAGLGFGEVEFAGYYGHSAKDIRRFLNNNGLTTPSAHISFDMLKNTFDATMDFAAEVGQRYLVLPSTPREDRTSLDRYKFVADTLNTAGEKAKAAGMEVAYHNHAFEFKELEGMQPYEILLERTDPDLVKLELDLYWLNVANIDPLDIIARYPGRVPLMHIKDRRAAGEMTYVGGGAIDFNRVFDHAKQAGLKHYIVEHDNPTDPIASVSASITYMREAFPWLCA